VRDEECRLSAVCCLRGRTRNESRVDGMKHRLLCLCRRLRYPKHLPLSGKRRAVSSRSHVANSNCRVRRCQPSWSRRSTTFPLKLLSSSFIQICGCLETTAFHTFQRMIHRPILRPIGNAEPVRFGRPTAGRFYSKIVIRIGIRDKPNRQGRIVGIPKKSFLATLWTESWQLPKRFNLRHSSLSNTHGNRPFE